MSFEERIDRLGRVLDAAKAINRELPANVENAWQGVGTIAIPIRLLVDLSLAIKDVRDSAEKPCIHSRHTAWMHEVGYGHLCEVEA